MQRVTVPHALRNEIRTLASECGLDSDCYTEMLDYTIDLFNSQGLGSDYFGYHNIDHELEVTYVTLLAAKWDSILNEVKDDDMKYLYAAALFHDFDPQKSVDKPHEESVIKFISLDRKLRELLDSAGLDIELIKVLIHRTTFPWAGKLKKDAEEKIEECFQNSDITRNDQQARQHYMQLGEFLSIVDRVSGYTLGDFSKGMDMAKKNAHALGWHPSLITQRSVSYFETLLNKEAVLTQRVLKSLPQHMRKNFMDNVLSFFKLREREIQIQGDYIYDNLKLVPVIEKMSTRSDESFIKTLYDIYLELPKPLQFDKENFDQSIKNPEIILNTLRKGDCTGEIIGFAKGGPLESYTFRPEIRDENYGLNNTAFLEPVALKMGYWGLRGGSEMRHLFTMQAHSKKFKYLTSFALRDVIRKRVESHENAEFVALFDPERWDYYRIQL